MNDDNFIHSPENPHFKKWKKLLQVRQSKKIDLFIVSGQKWIPEWLEKKSDIFVSVLILEHMELPAHLPSWIHSYVLSKKLFTALDIHNTQAPLWIGKAPKPQKFLVSPNGPRVFLALSDPQNLGLALRSCAAFAWQEVVLLKECCWPWNEKVVRACAGCLLDFNFYEGPSIQELPASLKLTYLDLNGASLYTHQFEEQPQLLLGQEGQGLPSHIEGQALNIPIKSPAAESLNSAAALTLALYEHRRHWPLQTK